MAVNKFWFEQCSLQWQENFCFSILPSRMSLEEWSGLCFFICSSVFFSLISSAFISWGQWPDTMYRCFSSSVAGDIGAHTSHSAPEILPLTRELQPPCFFHLYGFYKPLCMKMSRKHSFAVTTSSSNLSVLDLQSWKWLECWRISSFLNSRSSVSTQKVPSASCSHVHIQGGCMEWWCPITDA